MNGRILAEVDLATRSGPIDLVLDWHWLSELVGHRVQARRIRHKPGVGVVASYGPPSGPECGWVQLVERSAADKIVNAERRAAQRNRAVTVRSLTSEWTALHGPVASDPRLHRALDQLPTEVVDGLTGSKGVQLLRYNPHRRLVLGWGDTVLRLTQSRQADVVAVARVLATAGISAAETVRMPGVADGRRVTAWPWVDGVDLLAEPRAEGAVAAGELLARWHAQPVAGAPAALRPLCPSVSPLGVLDELVALQLPCASGVSRVVQALLPRMGRERADVPARWSHGDFSADQIVALCGGGVRVIDLDRSTLAPAGADLGSFCAVESLREQQGAPAAELSAGLLCGYAQAGGTLPSPEALRDWTVYWLLTRLTEPMRHAHPAWRVGIARRWAHVQQVLET